MKFQDRFDTALHILLKEGKKYKQKEISQQLLALGVKPSSPAALSRAKSQIAKGTNNRVRLGELAAEQLIPIVEGLETLLKKQGIILAKDQKSYFQKKTNKKWLPIYNEDPEIELVASSLGLLRSYPVFPLDYISNAIKNAKEEVRILGTYLTDSIYLRQCCEQALRNGAEVKVLLMDPSREAARLRSKGLTYKRVNVPSEIYQNRYEFEELTESFPNFSISYYNEIPGPNIIAVDERILIGWFWFQEYAVGGCYLEFDNDKTLPLISNVDSHWRKLWAKSTQKEEGKVVFYRCHYIRKGVYEAFTLRINSMNNEASITDSPSGDEYSGNVEFNLKGYCSIKLETEDKSGRSSNNSRRMATFLINIGANESIGIQDFAIAVYSNISRQGRAFANIMVLEKGHEEEVCEDSLGLIKEYLMGTVSELAINKNIVNDIDDLRKAVDDRKKSGPLDVLKRKFIKDLSGEYRVLTLELNEDTRKQYLAQRALLITENGEAKFKNSIDEGVPAKVKVLNLQNVLIEKKGVEGLVSFFYIIQPVLGTMSRLFGRYAGVSRSNLPKASSIYLIKEDGAYENVESKRIELDSEECHELALSNPKFMGHFSIEFT